MLDNAGVRLTLNNPSFTPAFKRSTGDVYADRFMATIARIDGTPAEKLPPAQQAQQPYVFMMSRNRALLERVVPVAKPTSEEAKALLARLERYKEKRRVEDPKGAKERCGLYIRAGEAATSYVPQDETWWRPLRDEPPPTAEFLYANLNGDGHVDFLVRLLETDSRIMVRILRGDGRDSCVLRTYGGNRRPLFRPITVLKTRECVYAYTNEYEQPTNSWQRIVPLQGASESCRHHDVWRWYERH